MNKTGKRIKITVEGKGAKFLPKNISVKEALDILGVECPYPIVGALLGNKVVELNRKITFGGSLKPLHLGTIDGMRLYQRSLSFVLVRAVKEVYPGFKVYINHSLSKGFYAELVADDYDNILHFHLTEKDVLKIKKRMQEIIDADEPFIRNQVPLEEGLKIFKKLGQMDKVRLLRYRARKKDQKVSIYQCGPEKNHFYGYLVPSTGYLKSFDLKFYSPGFILRFPSIDKPQELPEYMEQEKMFQVYKEYEGWAKILGLETVALLNDLISSGGINEFICVAEALHEKKIAYISDRIKNLETEPRIVLIGGPSCSGKTTFSKRLCIQLRVNGYRPIVISTDDFFVDREHTPRDEYGELDFEAFDSIDYKYLNRVIRDLFKGKSVQMPRFDFPTGKREKGKSLKMENDQIIILEGIHSLNDRLLSTIPEGLKFKIYVSALTTLNIDFHNRISTSDSRVLRRIVRDSKFRSYSCSDTLSRWPSVRRGEEKNIFPYQENADVMFNSAHVYEIGVLKKYAVPQLREIGKNDSMYSEARRLLKFISYFLDVDDENVPPHSILREFIGGSSFNY
jgi:uridine kinase